MKLSIKRPGFVLTAAPLLGATAVLAGSIALFSSSAPNAAELPETVDIAASAADVCVDAFSKDICEGALKPGLITIGNCPGTNCRTADVDSAVWSFDLRHNERLCANDGRCDEAFEKDGRVTVRVDYTMRLNEPCPYRTCFTGTWILEAVDGTVYEGSVYGTMGVGSHRPNACEFGGRNCERCMDVERISNTTWRLGTEANFVGRRVSSTADERDEICFSLSGDFHAPASDDGLLNVFDAWRFAGTADGTHIHCGN